MVKTKSFKLGGNRPNGALGLRAQLSLELLGLNYIHVYGYRGTAKTFAAVKRNEVQAQTSPLSLYRAVVEPNLINTGKAIPLYYHPAINAAGKIVENQHIKDISTFPAF